MHGRKEFRRYLDISLGSLAEVAYLLRLAKDLEIMSPSDWLTLDSLRKRAVVLHGASPGP